MSENMAAAPSLAWRRCAVFSRGSSDLSPPALRTLRRPSAAAITKADNTGCVTTGTANTSKMWQYQSGTKGPSRVGRQNNTVVAKSVNQIGLKILS